MPVESAVGRWFRFGRQRRKILRHESALPMRAVAEGFSRGNATATKRDIRLVRRHWKRIAQMIHHDDRPLDNERTIFATTNSDRRGHTKSLDR